MAVAAGTDTVPAMVEEGKQVAIIAAGPVGQIAHGFKAALGQGSPAFLADQGDERLLGTVASGGLQVPHPTWRLRFDDEPEIETDDFIVCFGIGFRLPVRSQGVEHLPQQACPGVDVTGVRRLDGGVVVALSLASIIAAGPCVP
jgi:hypothetical protein